jgi:lipopolysaccharide transport system ATP-binding protein
MPTAIHAEHLSKIYHLGEIGTGTLSRDLERWVARVRGKEDPFLKIGETNDRSVAGTSDVVYSLKDMNFRIDQGDSVGIIGKNGAGKSTLLKILSRVTSPTTGRIKIRGRVASLLEVGTGFHPELTGKENIYLNGAILGMRKREIDAKLDEIIAFSGVERYIGTPVKRYSSGMYVRLAFAVAAHLEPEILIVDEVLAVGDAEFQKKCLGKMKDVSGEGRTVLFVSHNMPAVKSLCKNALLLRHGELVMQDTAERAVAEYLVGGSDLATRKTFSDDFIAEGFVLHEISIRPAGREPEDALTEGTPLELHSYFTIPRGEASRYHMTWHLVNEQGDPLFSFSHLRDEIPLRDGLNKLICHFPGKFFNVGTFYLSLLIVKDKKQVIRHEKDILSFVVADSGKELGRWMGKEPGSLKPGFEWTFMND